MSLKFDRPRPKFIAITATKLFEELDHLAFGREDKLRSKRS